MQVTPLLEIKSHSHPYAVEGYGATDAVFASLPREASACLVDQAILDLHRGPLEAAFPAPRLIAIEATEPNKSYEALGAVFQRVIQSGLRRDGTLVVIGGGVLQDIGCFIATNLYRGIRWELVPTTLLAQCDSCIGSKSSLNIGAYKNQIGSFFPPHRILLCSAFLDTLPWDEVRSGLGEAIKLHLLKDRAAFLELMEGLRGLPGDRSALAAWTLSALRIKQPFIEADEFDRGIRNILNYGHTFGHAYESVTHYAIPHGIAVVLGMLTATFFSMRLGRVDEAHYREIARALKPWHEPYGERLRGLDAAAVVAVMKQDKKNTRQGVNCILTGGYGRMERTAVDEAALAEALAAFLSREC